MTRTLYDSTNALAIPAGVFAAGYDPSGNAALDSGIAWSDSNFARFPNPVHIARFPGMGGDVADYENGDFPDIASLATWIKQRQAAGYYKPSVYFSLSRWSEVQTGLSGMFYDKWYAHYDDDPNNIEVPGAVAKQYADSALTGQDYDLSIVLDDGWPHRTKGGTPMPQVVTGSQSNVDPRGSGAVYLLMEPFKLYLTVPSEVSSALAFYGQSGIKTIDQSLLDRYIDLGNTGSGIYQTFDTNSITTALQNITTALQNLQTTAGTGLTTTQAQQLSNIAQSIAAIEAALKQA